LIPIADHHPVGTAVAVEVACKREKLALGGTPEICTPECIDREDQIECPVAVAQKYTLIGALDHRPVGLAVAVEVSCEWEKSGLRRGAKVSVECICRIYLRKRPVTDAQEHALIRIDDHHPIGFAVTVEVTAEGEKSVLRRASETHAAAERIRLK
jgi:hypothetical protein